MKASGYSPPFSYSPEYPALVCVMLLCEPIPVPPSPDMPVSKHMFVSRHNMDMRVITCDDR